VTTGENEQEGIPAAEPAEAPPEPAAAPEAVAAPAPESPAAPPFEAMAAPARAAEAGEAPAPESPAAPPFEAVAAPARAAAGAAPARAPYPPSDRGPRRDSGGDAEGGPRRRHFGRRRVCAFCADKVASIDYKDAMRLRRFLSDRARIEPRRKTGTCAKHQRWLASALKRARHLAMLPYTPEHIRTSGVSTGRGR